MKPILRKLANALILLSYLTVGFCTNQKETLLDDTDSKNRPDKGADTQTDADSESGDDNYDSGIGDNDDAGDFKDTLLDCGDEIVTSQLEELKDRGAAVAHDCD